ncbi:MAG: hypothetical protein H7331_04875 [Bacteroidia bacterium]|nr:hypothetical protein [Bacteroidia bacterium]
MENITTTIQLIEAIRLLEIKQKQDEQILKEQVKITYNSLKPSVLIKNTIKDLIAPKNSNTNLLSTALSMVAGYTSKKIVVGETKSTVKQLLGDLLQLGVTNVISNNSNGIVLGIASLIKVFASKKNEKEQTS